MAIGPSIMIVNIRRDIKVGLKGKQTVTSGKIKGERKFDKAMKHARRNVHLFVHGWSELRCDDCGLSKSNPIHDFRDPPGIGRI